MPGYWTPPLVAGGHIDLSFQLDPGGTRAVYRADQEVDERWELYSVRIDGSAGATKLNGTLVSGGDVRIEGFKINPSGTRVLYLANQDNSNVVELYSVPIDGSAAPTKVHPALPPGRGVRSFEFSPDGLRVAYVADQDQNDVFELYSAPSDGSAPAVKLSGCLVAGGNVSGQNNADCVFTSDGTTVVYCADQDIEGRFELYSVPSTGGAVPIKVSSSTTSVSYFKTRPGHHSVVYKIGLSDLFLAPTDGSSGPVLVSGSAPGKILDAGLLPPSGSFVLFRAEKLEVEHFDLLRSILP